MCVMNKNLRTLPLGAIGFVILGAALFAGVFALLGLSQNTIEDLVFGTVVGILSGIVVALVVGVINQALIQQKKEMDLVGCSICNAIIGAFSGAIVTTFVVIVMVSLMHFPANPANPEFWGVFLGRLVGTPLGIVMGLTIGGSWRWLQLRRVA